VPLGYIQDPLASNFVLPEGWDSDAWVAPDEGKGYFLRAWNDNTGQVAIVQSETSFEKLADKLREKVKNGGDWIGIVR